MPEFYDHAELADEAGYLAVVRRLPHPVPPDLRLAEARLRAFGKRRGWAWPYRNYVPPARRTQPDAAPASVGTLPVAPAPIVDTDTPGPGHVRFDAEYEYWRADGQLWRARRDAPLRQYGERRPCELAPEE